MLKRNQREPDIGFVVRVSHDTFIGEAAELLREVLAGTD